MPENIKGQAISTVDVKGLYRCDREKAWTIFGEGKEIIEKPETPVDEGGHQKTIIYLQMMKVLI